jgi:hypothetical protein
MRFVIMHCFGCLVKAFHIAIMDEAAMTRSVSGNHVAYGNPFANDDVPGHLQHRCGLDSGWDPKQSKQASSRFFCGGRFARHFPFQAGCTMPPRERRNCKEGMQCQKSDQLVFLPSKK